MRNSSLSFQIFNTSLSISFVSSRQKSVRYGYLKSAISKYCIKNLHKQLGNTHHFLGHIAFNKIIHVLPFTDFKELVSYRTWSLIIIQLCDIKSAHQ